MADELLRNLGPLAPFAGFWEGNKGDDVAPADDPLQIENNKFRERMSFEPFGPINNHQQCLYGLRYSRMAWRLGEAAAFHEDTGYMLWDADAKQVMRCFIIPRGVTVLAGGTVEPGAHTFQLSAVAGSDTYGICSNLFLDKEFKTIQYDITLTIQNNILTYNEDTHLKMRGQPEVFHHIDQNTLKKVHS